LLHRFKICLILSPSFESQRFPLGNYLLRLQIQQLLGAGNRRSKLSGRIEISSTGAVRQIQLSKERRSVGKNHEWRRFCYPLQFSSWDATNEGLQKPDELSTTGAALRHNIKSVGMLHGPNSKAPALTCMGDLPMADTRVPWRTLKASVYGSNVYYNHDISQDTVVTLASRKELL
jgi:hypothetical protein